MGRAHFNLSIHCLDLSILGLISYLRLSTCHSINMLDMQQGFHSFTVCPGYLSLFAHIEAFLSPLDYQAMFLALGHQTKPNIDSKCQQEYIDTPSLTAVSHHHCLYITSASSIMSILSSMHLLTTQFAPSPAPLSGSCALFHSPQALASVHNHSLSPELLLSWSLSGKSFSAFDVDSDVWFLISG